MTYIFTKAVFVKNNGEVVIPIYVKFSKLNGSTVSIVLSSVISDSPSAVDFSPVHVSYLGSIPSGPRIDGGFGEWKILNADGKNDTLMPQNLNPEEIRSIAENADITKFGRIVSNKTYFYVESMGEILRGTYIGDDSGLKKIEEGNSVRWFFSSFF